MVKPTGQHPYGTLHLTMTVEQIKIKDRLTLKNSRDHFLSGKRLQSVTTPVGVLGQDAFDMLVNQTAGKIRKNSNNLCSPRQADRPILTFKLDMFMLDFQSE